MTSYLSIPEYYTDKNVFITGATGFIGKVLIEKILRSCPNVGNLYILVRPKKAQDCYQRIQEMTQSSVFDKVRADNPNFYKKLIPVHGDMTEIGLGISKDNIELLSKTIHVVFHSAATIRFNEPLRVAMNINVLGVRKMIQLCLNFKMLEVFVHVSTAYANCDQPFIEEKVYSPSVEPQKLIDAMEWMNDDMIDVLTPRLIGNKPNTYTFTKHLAEHLLIMEGSSLPLAIVRPSIVGASWMEPFPGWVDNFSAPSGICIATGKGILRSMRGDSLSVCDLVPVDFAVNMMISVGWYIAQFQPKTVLIFHSTIGNVNPFTWGEIVTSMVNNYRKHPLDSCFRRPKLALTKSGALQNYYLTVSHMIPAYIIDLSYSLFGKPPRMVKIYNKLHRLLQTISFFTTQSWEWTYKNLDMLNTQLSADDRECFYLDPRHLHWPTYMEAFCKGTKRYLLKEDISGLPAAKAHLNKLRNIRYIFNTVILIVLWRLIISRTNIAGNLWIFILNLFTKYVK